MEEEKRVEKSKSSSLVRVLLVEDNSGDARLIQEMLVEARNPSFDLECSNRLSIALKHLATRSVDVVLLDLSLPDSWGFDTFASLHAQAPHVPIIVLTGFADEELAVKIVREGAQDYLVKEQVDSNLLVRTIRYAIERKRSEETIRWLAYHDSLTNLPNRALFNDRLTIALTHAHRGRQKLVVMLLDLDQFKEINDTLGHSVGDKLLQLVGSRLTNLLRKGDTVARVGGDEFLLLLPGITRMEDATNIAQKILELFQEPFVLNNQKLYITTSIGIVTYPNNGEDADILIKNADIAMYYAKKKGRNNYQHYTPTMNIKTLR